MIIEKNDNQTFKWWGNNMSNRKHQELNQCLEQLPNGSNMKKSIWEQEAKILFE